jgi:lipoprotein-releasing system permease protein
MNFELFVCLRYLKATKKQGFISLISIISVSGVALGVTALIVVIAVMTGFGEEFRDKILGVNSHIVIQQFGGSIRDPEGIADTVRKHKDVTGVMPYIYGQSMITSGQSGSGCVVRGIDPDSAKMVLDLPDQLVQGDLDSLKISEDNPTPGIIIGIQLSRQLRAEMGDRLRLLSPSGTLSPIGILPKVKTLMVTGIFETGMFEYDSSLVYIPLETAQTFFQTDHAVHGLEVTVKNIDHARLIAEDLRLELGNLFIVKDWMSMNQNLFSALKLEKTAMFVILTLIVLVAAFNIVSTLIMVVIDKTKDIAILKAMGAHQKQILRIFMYEGLIIGLTGTIIGLIGGLSICEILQRYKLIELPGNVYPMTTLPIKILPMDITIIGLSAVLITLLATIYPAWKGSSIEPAKALRS